MQARAWVCVLAVLALLGGCGDEEASDPGPPAAAQSGGEGAGDADGDAAGAPDPGEPAYTGLGSWWVKLSSEERLSSAAEFIADNPDDCGGISAEDLERQTGIAYGLDFPLTATASQVMLETCAVIRNGG